MTVFRLRNTLMIIQVLALAGILCLSAGPARAACASPAGAAGDLMFNSMYNVMQYCDDTQWIGITYKPQGGCPVIGQECADGTVYAGVSPDGGVPMYTIHCDLGMIWNGASCTGTRNFYAYNNANASGDTMASTTSTTDGNGNTTLLLATDADGLTGGVQPHQAAQACGDLGAHGYMDWHLPALDELAVLRTNLAAIGGFNTTTSPEQRLWSSTESGQFTAWRQNFGTGVQGDPVKDELNSVRCVRVVAAGAGCSSPVGAMGDIIYNSTSHVMQYCDGVGIWRAMGRMGTAGGCIGPAGAEGDLLYNNTTNTLQYCAGSWIAVGK